MDIGIENGNTERDNVPDLPSEDNEASQHYTPVDLHSNDCDATLGSKQSSGARRSLPHRAHRPTARSHFQLHAGRVV
jgi:hypothetical protein